MTDKFCTFECSVIQVYHIYEHDLQGHLVLTVLLYVPTCTIITVDERHLRGTYTGLTLLPASFLALALESHYHIR